MAPLNEGVPKPSCTPDPKINDAQEVLFLGGINTALAAARRMFQDNPKKGRRFLKKALQIAKIADSVMTHNPE